MFFDLSLIPQTGNIKIYYYIYFFIKLLEGKYSNNYYQNLIIVFIYEKLSNTYHLFFYQVSQIHCNCLITHALRLTLFARYLLRIK